MKNVVFFFLVIIAVSSLVSCSDSERGAGHSDYIPAPSFVLTDLNNKKVSLSDFKGKVIMLEFFAAWCPPCHMMAPEIQAVYEKYKKKGFVVIAISMDMGDDAVSRVNSFIYDYKVSYPVLFDDAMVSREYDIRGVPTSFIIDKKGRIRSKHPGFIHDLDFLHQEIEALL
ncbi:MAG: TlpA disulfide reductase family protein [Thermodesulfovibrionales bacterium]|nr:TlpA disulfide reductase family protein [Thermodesulfovibrionales bacterium]